jgi:hypothetical protein
MVYNAQNYSGSGLCKSSGILETGKQNVRFEVFTAVIMKDVVFWDIKKPVHTSQETHDVSTTEPIRLILCKF